MKKLFFLLALLFPFVAFAADPSDVSSVDSIAILQAKGVAAPFFPIVNVATYYGSGLAGGGGTFQYLSSGCGTIDGGAYIAITGGPGGSCYKRLFPSGAYYDPHDWGCKFDGSFDNKACLTAALAFMTNGASKFGNPATTTLFLKPLGLETGQVQISDQIIIPYAVNMKCDGPRSILFHPTTNFTKLSQTGAIRLGDGSGFIYDTRVENCGIYLLGFTGAIGFFTSDAQDWSGFIGDAVYYSDGGCFILDGSQATTPGSVNTYVLYNNECYHDPSSTSGTGIGYLVKNSTFPGTIFGNDTFSSPSHGWAAAFQFDNAIVYATSFTFEGPNTADIVLTSSVITAYIGTVTCKDPITCVKVSTANSVVIQNLFSITATNFIVDDGNGGYPAQTIPCCSPANMVSYTRGNSSYFTGIINNAAMEQAGKLILDRSTSVVGRANIQVGTSAGGCGTDILCIQGVNTDIHLQTGTGGQTDALTVLENGTLLYPLIPTSAPATHCALWSNSGVINITTCP